jgi:hypothetical protein
MRAGDGAAGTFIASAQLTGACQFTVIPNNVDYLITL